jgi:hypothetical protein
MQVLAKAKPGANAGSSSQKFVVMALSSNVNGANASFSSPSLRSKAGRNRDLKYPFKHKEEKPELNLN